MPNLSSILVPLLELLRKNASWKWSTEQQGAFEKAKNQLQSSDGLVHYDPKKEFLGSCYTSPNGIGATLAHVMEDDPEKPELHMPHEAPSISFGRHFKIYTDRKPFLRLLSKMQRWVLTFACIRAQAALSPG